jgi:hypothetical protein
VTRRLIFWSGYFLCFAFFTVVDSSQRAAIVPGFIVDSSHSLIHFRYRPSLTVTCFPMTSAAPRRQLGLYGSVVGAVGGGVNGAYRWK